MHCSVVLDAVCSWQDAHPVLCDGRPYDIIHADHDCLWLQSVEGLKPDACLSQSKNTGATEDLMQELVRVWQPRWDKHVDIPASRWDRSLAFAKAKLPFGRGHWDPINPAALKQVISQKNRRTSAGLDGVSITDLWAMPGSVLNHFCRMFATAEVSRLWPSQLIDGQVTCLAKSDHLQTGLDFPQITIFGLLYRFWGTFQAKQAVGFLNPLLPEHLYGSRPGHHAAQVWARLLWTIEHA